MKQRHIAVFAAALLVLTAMTGCKAKPGSIAPSEQPAISDGTEAPKEAAPGDVDISGGDARVLETKEDGSPAASTEALQAASVPAELNGELTPIQVEPTVDVSKLPTHPVSADDDQEGEYNPPPAAAAPETRPDRPAETAAPVVVQNNDATPARNDSSTPTALNTKGGAPDGKLQITVETVEITLDQLKSQNYKVDVTVTLDKNPGIIYSEWGLKLDDRCTYEADSEGLPFETISFINDEAHFLWTAWSSGANATTRSGALLTLHVTVPREARSGSAYVISYASESLAPAPHLWQNDSTSYVALNEVGWTNGGILVK